MVRAIPGMSSIISPIIIISALRLGTSRHTAQMPRPTINEHKNFAIILLGQNFGARPENAHTITAKAPATSASSSVPPKNTAKAAAARTLPT